MSTPQPSAPRPSDGGTSTAETAEPETYDCNYCGGTYDPYDEALPGFCSWLCWGHFAAEKILNVIDGDHRYCSNCYRKRVDTYPPGRRAGSREVKFTGDSPEADQSASMTSVPDFAIDRAYPRPHTETAQGELLRPRDAPRGDWRFEPTSQSVMRPVCECGATHNSTIDRPVPPDRLLAFGATLAHTVTRLFETEEIDWPIDRMAFVTYLSDLLDDPDAHKSDQQDLIRDALAHGLIEARHSAPHAAKNTNS